MMIAEFMGERVDQMPRADLERHFTDARLEIERLRAEIAERSIEHIRNLAATRRSQMKMKNLIAFILSLFEPQPSTRHERPPHSHGR